jgi:hypothetical protein
LSRFQKYAMPPFLEEKTLTEWSSEDVREIWSRLAVVDRVSVSTQNQGVKCPAFSLLRGFLMLPGRHPQNGSSQAWCPVCQLFFLVAEVRQVDATPPRGGTID